MLATKNGLGLLDWEFQNSFLAFRKLLFSGVKKWVFKFKYPHCIGLGRRNCRHISTGIQTPHTTFQHIFMCFRWPLSLFSPFLPSAFTSSTHLGILLLIINTDFLFYPFPIKSIISFSSIQHPVDHKIVSSPIQRWRSGAMCPVEPE